MPSGLSNWAATTADLFRVCEEFLDHDRPMPLEPFPLALKHTDLMAGEQH